MSEDSYNSAVILSLYHAFVYGNRAGVAQALLPVLVFHWFSGAGLAKADLAQTRKDLRQLALEVHGLTTCDKAGEVLPLKSVDPPCTAVME